MDNDDEEEDEEEKDDDDVEVEEWLEGKNSLLRLYINDDTSGPSGIILMVDRLKTLLRFTTLVEYLNKELREYVISSKVVIIIIIQDNRNFIQHKSICCLLCLSSEFYRNL